MVVSKADEARTIQELRSLGENAFPLGVIEDAQNEKKVLITSET
jgi:hypothetical protein